MSDDMKISAGGFFPVDFTNVFSVSSKHINM